MNELTQLIIYAIFISFIIYSSSFVFYFMWYRPRKRIKLAKKNYILIEDIVQKIDAQCPEDKAKRNEDIREEREQLFIQSGLKPYEVEYYQKKKQEETKNGITKRLIEEKNRREESSSKPREAEPKFSTKNILKGFAEWRARRKIRKQQRKLERQHRRELRKRDRQPRWQLDTGTIGTSTTDTNPIVERPRIPSEGVVICDIPDDRTATTDISKPTDIERNKQSVRKNVRKQTKFFE